MAMGFRHIWQWIAVFTEGASSHLEAAFPMRSFRLKGLYGLSKGTRLQGKAHHCLFLCVWLWPIWFEISMPARSSKHVGGLLEVGELILTRRRQGRENSCKCSSQMLPAPPQDPLQNTLSRKPQHHRMTPWQLHGIAIQVSWLRIKWRPNAVATPKAQRWFHVLKPLLVYVLLAMPVMKGRSDDMFLIVCFLDGLSDANGAGCVFETVAVTRRTGTCVCTVFEAGNGSDIFRCKLWYRKFCVGSRFMMLMMDRRIDGNRYGDWLLQPKQLGQNTALHCPPLTPIGANVRPGHLHHGTHRCSSHTWLRWSHCTLRGFCGSGCRYHVFRGTTKWGGDEEILPRGPLAAFDGLELPLWHEKSTEECPKIGNMLKWSIPRLPQYTAVHFWHEKWQ